MMNIRNAKIFLTNSKKNTEKNRPCLAVDLFQDSDTAPLSLHAHPEEEKIPKTSKKCITTL